MIMHKKQERRRKRHEMRSAPQPTRHVSRSPEDVPPSEPYNRENEYDKGAESKMYYREGHPHSAPNHQSSFSGNFCFCIFV